MAIWRRGVPSWHTCVVYYYTTTSQLGTQGNESDWFHGSIPTQNVKVTVRWRVCGMNSIELKL
jgi:hypothetical protein